MLTFYKSIIYMEKYTIKHFIPKKSNVEGKVPTTASTVE